MTTALLDIFRSTPQASQASHARTTPERSERDENFEGILNKTRNALEDAKIGDNDQRVNRLAALAATSGKGDDLRETLRDLLSNLEDLQTGSEGIADPLTSESDAQVFLGNLAATIEQVLQKLGNGQPGVDGLNVSTDALPANFQADLKALLARIEALQGEAGNLTIDGDKKSTFQALLRDFKNLQGLSNTPVADQSINARLESQSLLTQAQAKDGAASIPAALNAEDAKAQAQNAANANDVAKVQQANQQTNQQTVPPNNLAERQAEDTALRFGDLNQPKNGQANNPTINELAKFGEPGFKAGEGTGFVNGLTQAANQTNAPVTDPAALAALLNNQSQQRGAPGQAPNLPAGLQLSSTPFADETLSNFTSQITRQIVGGRDRFTVQLNPAELGRVDVRLLNNEDGTMNARIQVERSETLDLFQRDVRALERSLAQSGIKLSGEGIELSLKNQDQGGNNPDNPFAGFDGNEDQSPNDRDDPEAEITIAGAVPLVDDLDTAPPGSVVQTLYGRIAPGQLNIQV